MTKRKLTSVFKSKVVLEALSERYSLSELAQRHQVAPTQISTWKKEFLSNASVVFEKSTSKTTESVPTDRDELLRTIGEQKVEIDFLKKFKETGLNMLPLIQKDHPGISISHQCKLLGINRSTYYYTPIAEAALNLELMRLMDEHYLLHPYKGVPRMYIWLKMDKGYQINIKRIERLYYNLMGLRAIVPGPHTSKRHPEHAVYPYLLRNVEITNPNQVWATDITYIPMLYGYLYLMAVIDVHSRFILSWDISNTMDATWCAGLVQNSITRWGIPQIINTDQGSQFTAAEFTATVLDNGIKLSMDGKGRAIDNIFIERFWRTLKYEHVYLNPTSDGKELYKGIDTYMNYYNMERRHESLNYCTPYSQYQQKNK